MAAPRNKKSAAKSKSSRPASAKAKPAKKSAPARAKAAKKPAARPAMGAKSKPAKAAAKPKKPAPKPVKAVPVPVKVASGRAVAVKGGIAKPGTLKVGAKPVIKGKSDRTPRRGAQPETVRPLGMLPPESLARATHRPLPRPAAPARVVAPARPQPEPTKSDGASRVTEKDLKDFEDRLLLERRRILKEMGHLETTVLKINQRDSSGDLSGYSFHMADAGTDAMEREKAFLFASVEGRVLLEIDDALRRLYRGQYGSCETCGNPISRPRLEVMPQARLCISCKEKEERQQRGAI